MEQDIQGVPPAGSGQSGQAPEPASGLGHPATVPNADWCLPLRAGICAYDTDECTVTFAFDARDDVLLLVGAFPHRNRIRVCDDDLDSWTVCPMRHNGLHRGWQIWRAGRPVSGLFDERVDAEDALRELRAEAIATEARGAETPQSGSVHEGAGIAQTEQP